MMMSAKPFDVLAVAVDDGRHPVGHPDAGLARPVHLHDVGHHGDQREGVGGLGGEQRLGGLAEAGLVGEQEGPVPVGRGRDHLGLVLHQLEGARQHHVAGLGQRHGGGRAVADDLEGAEQRAEQLPPGQPAGLATVLGGGLEVGGQERVGQLAGEDGLRDHAPFDGQGRVEGLLLVLLLDLDAGALEHRLAHLGGLVGDLGVLREQGEEGRLAGGRLGQDRGDAVEPLELAVALGLGQRGVGPDAGALLARQQRHGLEPRAHGDGLAAVDGRLDLAHGAREDRDQPLVVEGSGATLSAVRTTLAGPGLTLAAASQGNSSPKPGDVPGRPATGPVPERAVIRGAEWAPGELTSGSRDGRVRNLSP